MKIGPTPPDALRVDAKTVGAERAETPRSGASADPVASPQAIDRVSLSRRKRYESRIHVL